MKKNNIINRIAGLFFSFAVMLALCAHPVYAANLPDYSSKIFVTDNAKVLSEAVEDYIVNRCNTLRNNMMSNKDKEVNVVVLTVDFLPDGYDSEEYANAVANYWKIGSNEVDGMLILIVPGEYKQWITVSKGLEKHFSGGELTNIIYDHFPDEGFDENYDNAVKGVVDDVMDEMASIYGSAATASDYQGGSNGGSYDGYDNYNSYDNYGNYNSYGVPFRGGVNFMWVIVAIVVLVVFLARPRRRYYGGGYGRPRGGFFFGPMFWGGPRGPRGPMGGPRGGHRGGFGGGSRGGGFGGFGGSSGGFGGGRSGGGFGGFGGGGGGFRGGGGGRK